MKKIEISIIEKVREGLEAYHVLGAESYARDYAGRSVRLSQRDTVEYNTSSIDVLLWGSYVASIPLEGNTLYMVGDTTCIGRGRKVDNINIYLADYNTLTTRSRIDAILWAFYREEGYTRLTTRAGTPVIQIEYDNDVLRFPLESDKRYVLKRGGYPQEEATGDVVQPLVYQHKHME